MIIRESQVSSLQSTMATVPRTLTELLDPVMEPDAAGYLYQRRIGQVFAGLQINTLLVGSSLKSPALRSLSRTTYRIGAVVLGLHYQVLSSAFRSRMVAIFLMASLLQLIHAHAQN